MRRIAPWTSVIVTSFGLSLAAQTTGSSQAGMGSNDTPQKTVTVTGCIERGDRIGEFKLTNIDRSPMPGTAGTSGTTPATQAAPGQATTASPGGEEPGLGLGKELRLSATGTVRLDEHVGHKVEVTGAVPAKEPQGTVPGAAGTAGTPGTPGTAGTSGKALSTPDMKLRTLEVKSLRMIAAACR